MIRDRSEDLQLIRRLGVFFGPYRGLLIAAALSYPLASGLLLLQPYLMKVAIDRYLVPKDLGGFSWLLVGLSAAILAQFLAQYGQTLLTQTLGQRVTKDLRVTLFSRLQRVDLAYLERHAVGRLMTRVTNDVESLQETFSSGAVSIFGDLITLFGIIAMMLALDWRLTLYAFAVLPLLIWFMLRMRQLARTAFRAVRAKLSAMNGFLNEAISGMGLIQSFTQEQTQAARFDEANRAYRDENFAAIRFDAMTYAVVEGLSSVAVASLLLLGVGVVSQHVVDVGVFVAFVEYLRRFFMPINELSQKFTVLQSAFAAAERCVELLDERPTILEPEAPEAPGPLSGALSFDRVSFRYSADGPVVLPELSLSIEKGETVAIVGATGSGKSTIAKLIDRFYDPSSGSLRLDGVDLKAMSLSELRSRVAMVLQDPYLFEGSLRDNIDFGRALPAAQLEQAAEKSRAIDVIERMPGGWEASVGERGARLSAGERQLVAFARALASDPELIILDEATSSVDPETEGLIQEGLKALLSDRTAVVIAHRLSTVRQADRICVLARGRVIEQGSHAALLEQGGLYRRLYELQFT